MRSFAGLGLALINRRINLLCFIAGALFAVIESAQAAPGALVPPEVQAETQALEDRFNSAIADECPGKSCFPAGCEALRYRTLDQAQNASLPGLDMTDDAPAAAATSVQYKLESARCEFAFEPSLSAEAVASLRQRLMEKTRRAGLALTLASRKLMPAVAAIEAARSASAAPKALVEAPSTLQTMAPGMNRALPFAATILLATIGGLALIWAYRRLGMPKPVASVSPRDSEMTEISEDERLALAAIEDKQKNLNEIFLSHPEVRSAAFAPIVDEGNADELCLALRCFGAEALSDFSRQDEHAEIFAVVRKRYAQGPEVGDSVAQLAFLQKVERLATLAKLGRGEPTLSEEFAFLKFLAPDEFATLARDLTQDELIAVLSFAPAELRAHCLRAWPAAVADAYASRIAENGRAPEHSMRAVARRLKEHYESHRSEIKQARVDQLPLLEQLINALDPVGRKRVLSKLRADQPRLYDRVLSEALFDGALVGASEALLSEAFLTLTPEESAAYLRGNAERLAILPKLKAPLAASIRSRMATRTIGLGLDFVDSDGSEAGRARDKLSAIIKQKASNGDLNLRRLNEAFTGLV